MNIGEKDSSRFWVKVDKTGDCWQWTAAKNARGYGVFGIGSLTVLAHRAAWTLNNGEIPAGHFVCHKCDNPGCVNPSHLFVGTHADNMRDMQEKGRQGKKLTSAQVKKIRTMWRQGTFQRVIADAFGVTQAHVSLIVLEQAWAFEEVSRR